MPPSACGWRPSSSQLLQMSRKGHQSTTLRLARPLVDPTPPYQPRLRPVVVVLCDCAAAGSSGGARRGRRGVWAPVTHTFSLSKPSKALPAATAASRLRSFSTSLTGDFPPLLLLLPADSTRPSSSDTHCGNANRGVPPRCLCAKTLLTPARHPSAGGDDSSLRSGLAGVGQLNRSEVGAAGPFLVLSASSRQGEEVGLRRVVAR